MTVWDHRSSLPLAKFHTSASQPRPPPSFTADLAGSLQSQPREDGWTIVEDPETRVLLVDPISGSTQTGSSTSGREAARVVKFSPETSSRDLMVFTEVSLSCWLMRMPSLPVADNRKNHTCTSSTRRPSTLTSSFPYHMSPRHLLSPLAHSTANERAWSPERRV